MNRSAFQPKRLGHFPHAEILDRIRAAPEHPWSDADDQAVSEGATEERRDHARATLHQRRPDALLSKNGDVGMQEVRDKVNTILADLPDGTDPPIVDKFDTGSMPVLTIAVSLPSRALPERA